MSPYINFWVIFNQFLHHNIHHWTKYACSKFTHQEQSSTNTLNNIIIIKIYVNRANMLKIINFGPYINFWVIFNQLLPYNINIWAKYTFSKFVHQEQSFPNILNNPTMKYFLTSAGLCHRKLWVLVKNNILG